MNRSIMFSASKFSAHRGQPRAVGASTFPQSRHVFELMAVGLSLSGFAGDQSMHYSNGLRAFNRLNPIPL